MKYILLIHLLTIPLALAGRGLCFRVLERLGMPFTIPERKSIEVAVDDMNELFVLGASNPAKEKEFILLATGYIWPIISSLIPNSQKALEIMQDVFAEVYSKNRNFFVTKTKVLAYMLKQARWKSLEVYKRLPPPAAETDLLGRVLVGRVNYERLNDVPGKESSPENDFYFSVDLPEAVNKLLVRLNDQQKEILRRRIAGESFPTIGRSLDLSEDAVRKSFDRTMKRLRELPLPPFAESHFY